MLNTLVNLAARADAFKTSPYVYTPSTAATLAFLILFALATLVHLLLAFRYKYWIAFVTLIPGGILEIVGWGGRYWSAKQVDKISPFLMQTCCLILGPAFFSAWAYTLLGYCITRLGSGYSLLSPKMYLILFVSADIVSLVLQAIGGGQAAVAAENGKDTTKATHIMLAGIVFQLATMTIFVLLAADFIIRLTRQTPYTRQIRFLGGGPSPSPSSPTPPTGENDVEFKASQIQNPPKTTEQETLIEQPQVLKNTKLLLMGVFFGSLMIFIRGIYRSVELGQGWRGYLITHEDYFNYLDGLPMILCLVGLAVAHPGFLLPTRRGWRNA